MKQISFNDEYLSEIEFIAPAKHKLVYMFILMFRRCKEEEIVEGLGFRPGEVRQAIESLFEKNLIEIGSKRRLELPDKNLPLPIFRVLEAEDAKSKPSWYYPEG